MTISQLRAMARRLNQKNKISLWVVDYLQLVTCPEAHAKGNREQEVAQVAVGLKQLAKEMDAPVIVLSQLNDDGKLRESRATGQHADAIWKLNRSEGGNMHGEAVCLHVEKQRSGPRGPVNLTFIPKWTRFECAAKISDQDMPHND
jgi:replicative DNA helicase